MLIAVATFLLLATTTLQTGSVRPSQSPRDVYVEIYFATDAAVVQKHLLRSTMQQLSQAPEDLRGRLMTRLLGAQYFAKTLFVRSSPSTDGNAIIKIEQHFLPEPVLVMAEEEKIDDNNVRVRVFARNREFGRFNMSLVLRAEEGVWKIVSAEAEGKPVIPDLDKPGLVEKLQAMYPSPAEVKAITVLKAINNAQLAIASKDKEYASSLSTLAPIDKELAPLASCEPTECAYAGYRFTYQRIDADTYKVSARPIETGKGQRSFYTDQTTTIRTTRENREAIPTDSPVR